MCLEFERCNLRTGFRGVLRKPGIRIDRGICLKRGPSSLVDLGDFAFFLVLTIQFLFEFCGETCYAVPLIILLIGIISIKGEKRKSNGER
jgi:hypothetical protein